MSQEIIVAAMYKFVDLPDYKDLQSPLLTLCQEQGIKGTLLLAREGLNGTVAGSRQGIDVLQQFLREDGRFENMSYKESWAEDKLPFHRMRVRLKKEIVTMGQPNVNAHNAGTYVKPKDWNALISDPDVVLIDTRNDYEIDIGTFKGAINPNTVAFRDFPEWVEHQKQDGVLAPNPDGSPKKVAMFCTGGIRCEKSTAFMKTQGFDEVYHLQGGILKYLEDMPEQDSLWQGQCFVFDERISVGHGLVPGDYIQCHACRHPLTPEETQSPHYVRGESCPYCWGSHTEEQLQRYRQRQLQVDLAAERHEDHIGADMTTITEERRQQKIAAKEKAREAAKKSQK
ncbi:rhodanese-related sulfurtransferase [Brackiella oedipodis]|uniref:oxygen-dependent tRNA uridine(34) hydroxylase TrhO n=1 Tax=Brackiella oedipodis TaxID=124225 RepID=UPI0005703D1F|nr:rhodanese-related sulfurtransferase [Brackiella oedipodis]